MSEAELFANAASALQASKGAGNGSVGGDKSGLASLMRRAVQQAKTEAAAHRLQEANEAAAGKQTAEEPTGTETLPDLAPDQLSQHSDEAVSEQLQLLGLAGQQSDGLSSDQDAGTPLGKTLSLGARLGSILKSTFSPSRQSSYVPVDADSPPEAQQAQQAEPAGTGRRALPRDASLGQRLGSILTGGLSIPKDSSYASLSGGDDDSAPSEADADKEEGLPEQVVRHRALPRDASLGQRLGSILKGALSIPRQASYTSFTGDDDDAEPLGHSRKSVSFSAQHSGRHDADSVPERILPRELSLRERYGSQTLSRNPSYSSPADDSLAAPAAEDVSSAPISPGSRRALPRDASYLPEWVTRSHAQTLRGDSNGNASPRSRLGTSASNASSASDPDWDAAMPTWVDWPQATPRSALQTAPQQAEEAAPWSESEPAVPMLMAPPHLRRQQQASQKAASSLPRAKRPLTFAPDPLSLSLVHTPSMNPQLDLGPIIPVAPTPKGQQLFDFWHQKSEQALPAATDTQTPGPTPAVAPTQASEAPSSSAIHAGQPDSAQPGSSSTTQQAESAALSANAAQLQASASTEDLHQLAPSAATPQLPLFQSPQHDRAAAAACIHGAQAAEGMPSSNGDGSLTVQPRTELQPSAAFVAELQSATRLVHQQSLQQEALLEGLEHALSQLSEQRLLVQHPQSAAVIGSNEGVSSGGGGMLLPGCTMNLITPIQLSKVFLHASLCRDHVLNHRPVSLLRETACVIW